MDPIENHMVVDELYPQEKDSNELECGCIGRCKCDDDWDGRD